MRSKVDILFIWPTARFLLYDRFHTRFERITRRALRRRRRKEPVIEISTELGEGKATFRLDGKLTVTTSSDLSGAVDALPMNVRDIDIDLSDVSYISSAGLRVIVAASKLTSARQGTLLLLHPCDDVMDVFEMTGLSEVLAIER